MDLDSSFAMQTDYLSQFLVKNVETRVKSGFRAVGMFFINCLVTLIQKTKKFWEKSQQIAET